MLLLNNFVFYLINFENIFNFKNFWLWKFFHFREIIFSSTSACKRAVTVGYCNFSFYNYELRQYDIPYHYSVAAPDAPLRFPPPTLEKEESREAEKSPKGGHRFGGWWACSDGRFLILCTMGFTDFGRVGPDLPLFWGTTSPCYFISI